MQVGVYLRETSSHHSSTVDHRSLFPHKQA